MPTFNGQKLSLTEGTRQWFWDNHPFTASQAPDGRLVRWWLCTTCQNWVTEDGVQIGHHVEWRKHLADNGVTAASTFTVANGWYNDTANLIPQCKSCNAGHEWEFRNYQGEADDSSDEGEDGNLAGFVVDDSQCPYCQSDDTEQEDDGTYVCNACDETWPKMTCPHCGSEDTHEDDDDSFSCLACHGTWTSDDMVMS